MDFVSVKDTAVRWGLTVGRVNVLAKEGRIPGAQRIGRSWMIPADAAKPADGRYKQQQQTGKQYHFPLFLCHPYQDQSFLQGLSADEQKLLEGQLACESCDFDHALTILGELADSSRQLYVKIGALYYLCSIAPILNLPDMFKRRQAQLRDILATDFPHQEDFLTLMLDIDALCLGNHVYEDNFTLDTTKDYSVDAIRYLTIQSVFRDSIRSKIDRIPLSTNTLSLLCKDYEQSHLHYCAIHLHLYAAFAFTGSKDPFINISQLRKAVELGVAHRYYGLLATHYAYFKPAFDEVLKDFDPAIGEQIARWSQVFDSNVIAFLGTTASSVKIITELSEEQMRLMTFAAQGLTNKEVAKLTGIPEYTVRRRYEALLSKFNVPKKKQLAALFVEMLTDGYKS